MDDREVEWGGYRLRSWLGWLFAAACVLCAATPASAACSAPETLNDAAGTYSPAAVAAGTTGYASAPGGFTCTDSGVLKLLSNNYLRVTVTTATLALPSTTTNTNGTPIATLPVSLALGATGSSPLTPGNTVYVINGTTVNLLGLLGSGPMNVPIYIKPAATGVPLGVYKGVITLKWEWRFCPLDLVGFCVGVDAGTQNTAITFTLTVADGPTVVISSVATWDPVGKTTVPKVLVDGKVRLSMNITNPNTVPLDLNGLVLELPTPAKLAIALDGDGTGQGGVVQTAQGAKASGLALTFSGGSSGADDVDFSPDASGDNWGSQPVAGDAASQNAVKRVRFRPRGAMAAGSSYVISMPYSVQ